MENVTSEEVKFPKVIHKILAALPEEQISNPVAALINYCKHQLGFEPCFKSYEINNTFNTEVFFGTTFVLVVENYYKKSISKEVAARATLKKLNDDKAFLCQWIETRLNISISVTDLPEKRVSKILAALPEAKTDNPIAALINFCKHQLGFNPEFRCYELASNDCLVELYFENELITRAADRKKRTATKLAAIAALVNLNNSEFINQWIQNKLSHDNQLTEDNSIILNSFFPPVSVAIDLRDKRVNKIIAALPGWVCTNPNAALINFCNHQLRLPLAFKDFESIKDGKYHVQILIDNKLIMETTSKKKGDAKLLASKEVLKRFNKDEQFLNYWIQCSLGQANGNIGHDSSSAVASVIAPVSGNLEDKCHLTHKPVPISFSNLIWSGQINKKTLNEPEQKETDFFNAFSALNDRPTNEESSKKNQTLPPLSFGNLIWAEQESKQTSNEVIDEAEKPIGHSGSLAI